MARSAGVARVATALVALAGVAGCGGELIHLGGGDCAHAQVPASEVVWIGDSWVTVPGNQVTGVEDKARAANAIGPSDVYTVDAANGTVMTQIAAQYTAQEATATKAKVVIMDGGTLDTIMSNGSSASVTKVEATFMQLLGTMASDGTVTDVIYFLVPDLTTIPGVTALQPLLQADCAASAVVRCHFIDLRQPWSGHPEYTNTVSGVSFPSEAGAGVIADAIWSVMQQNCIAQ